VRVRRFEAKCVKGARRVLLVRDSERMFAAEVVAISQRLEDEFGKVMRDSTRWSWVVKV